MSEYSNIVNRIGRCFRNRCNMAMVYRIMRGYVSRSRDNDNGYPGKYDKLLCQGRRHV